MISEYEAVLERGRRNRPSYANFLRNLKKRKSISLDQLFAEAHDAAFLTVDCLECGSCCSGLGPRLRDKDIARLARRERMKPGRFTEIYLRTDEDGDAVFVRMPCPFFGADGGCLVYEDRPGACRDYPHMDAGRQRNRISGHIENLDHCPAVVLAAEFLMETLPSD